MRSIRARLMAGTAIGVAAMFALAGFVTMVVVRSSLYAQFDDGLATRARALSALIEQEGDVIETDLAREDVLGEYHQLWVGDRVMRRSRSLGARDLRRIEPPIAIEPVELPDGRDGRQVTLVFEPYQDNEQHLRATPIAVTFAVARDVDGVEATIATLRRVLILAGTTATLLALVVLLVAVRFGLGPVRALARSIAELREGTRLIASESPVELRSVVERLNELLGRLEGSVARERELTADVAHELRTPLAGLRATIELARSRERPAERYVAALDECLAIVLQTERTVTALLALARLDAGKETATSEAVSIHELVREVCATHAGEANRRGLTIERDGEAVWPADREKLRIVLANLVENAVAYANEGGMLRIEIDEQAIRVSNTGCTLAPADVARVFERFWRGDQARSARGHAGVGLAVSRKLVELVGGTLTAAVVGDRFIATIARTSEVGVDRARGRA